MSCPSCGIDCPPGEAYCLSCGTLIRPETLESHRPIRRLGTLLTVVMSAIIAGVLILLGLRLLDISPGGYGLASQRIGVVRNGVDWAMTCFAFMFVVWFRRVRINAEHRGYRQRRARGWTFWGWMVPVVNLWFPFQLMGDIWRAGLPPAGRRKTAWLVAGWWICWLATGFSVGSADQAGRNAERPGSFDPLPVVHAATGSAQLVAIALAATALVVIIRKVSTGPLGSPVPGQPI
jgi:Domain of unknown function (DUF4328)